VGAAAEAVRANAAKAAKQGSSVVFIFVILSDIGSNRTYKKMLKVS
jgi:hypothetical protein